MHLKFSDLGTSLGTRSLGRTIRLQIEDSIRSNDCVILDFKGVTVVSHAFADECFAKLFLDWDLEKVKSLTKFKNTIEPVKIIISFSISERINSLDKKSTVRQS